MKETDWILEGQIQISSNTKSNDTFGSVLIGMKPDFTEEPLGCATPFDQLFTKQRTYIQSEEVAALQGIHLKPEQSVSESEVDITSIHNFKECNQSQNKNNFNLNTIAGALYLDSAKSNISFTNADLSIPNANQRNEIKYSIEKKNDDKADFSFDHVSFNYPQQSELQMTPYRSPASNIHKDAYYAPISDKILDEQADQGDFLKAMQGVGNIFRFLGIIQPKMKRFYYTKTMSGKNRGLTSEVRRTVNDIADYHTAEEKKGFLKVIFSYLVNFLGKLYILLRINKIPIFNPENVVKIIFNCIIVCYNCFYLYLRSLEIFFKAEFGKYNTYFHYIAEACWVIEMIVQMNTSMYYHNHFTKDRKIIMKIYLEEYFFFEILPLIFDVKLIFQMMLFGHILACAFSIIISYEINFLSEQSQWQTLSIEVDQYWVRKYLLILYWSFKTMMNVNHESPSSNIELAFQCSAMLISSVAFGYLISAIGNILSEISKEQKEYKKDLNILNQFMKRKKVEIGLVRRANIQLKKYYEQQRRVRYLEENETLLKLNEYMMKELLISSNLKVLKRYPFFFNLFTNSTLQKICTKMQEKLFAPNQIIFDKSVEEQKEDYYLYFVVQGSISIEDQFNLNVKQAEKDNNHYRFLSHEFQNEEYIIDEEEDNQHIDEKRYVGRRVKNGDYFGLKGFFTGNEVMWRAISHDFSTVMVLSKRETEKIIKEEKRDFEKYMEISDKIKFSDNYSDLKTICQSCLSRYHSTYQCPKVYYDKDPLYTVSKQNFSNNQERKKLNRIQEKTRCALSTVNILQEQAHHIKIDYALDLMSDMNTQYTLTDEEILQDELEQGIGIDHHFRRETTTRTKTFHNNTEQKISGDIVEDVAKITQEINKSENRFEGNAQLLESNLYSIPENEGIYYDIPPLPLSRGRVVSISEQNIPMDIGIHQNENKNHIGGNFGKHRMMQSQQQQNESGNHIQSRQLITSIAGGKQDAIMRQLLEGMQNIIQNMNIRGNTRRLSNQISNLDVSMRIAPQTSFYRKGSTDKIKSDDTGSKRSALRNPLRQASIANIKGKHPVNADNIIEHTNPSKGIGHSHQINNEMQSTIRVFSDLDKMVQFEFYFPHSNSSEIIKKVNLLAIKNQKQIKVKKLKNQHGHIFKKSITVTSKNRDQKPYKIAYIPSKYAQ